MEYLCSPEDTSVVATAESNMKNTGAGDIVEVEENRDY